MTNDKDLQWLDEISRKLVEQHMKVAGSLFFEGTDKELELELATEFANEMKGAIATKLEQVELEARINEIYKCRDTLALSTHDQNRLIDRVSQLSARLTQKGKSNE